jgi:hypothetical protein
MIAMSRSRTICSRSLRRLLLAMPLSRAIRSRS